MRVGTEVFMIELLGCRKSRRRREFLRHRPAAFGLVVDVRLVGEVYFHRQNIADLVRALILEECARAVSP